MKYLIILVFLLSSCTTSLEERFKPQPVFYKQPAVSYKQLGNGLKVFYLQDKEVPLLRASAMIKGGERYVPHDVAGLSSALGQLMRTGGTEDLQPEQVQDKLDKLAASIEVNFGEDTGSALFTCLDGDLSEVISLYADILRKPAFNTGRLRSWKQKALSSISARDDDPATIARLTFKTGLFGSNSEYVKISTSETISKITWNDLVKFHRLFIQPEHISLAAVGSVSFEEFLAETERVFGDWKSSGQILPEIEAPLQVNKGKVFLVEKPINQSTVLMGHVGPPLNIPGIHSLHVFNQMFGLGGFSSKLVSEVRTKAGLAYSVYGAVFPANPLGKFQMGLATKSSSTVEGIKLILKTLDNQLKIEPEQTFLAEAKQATSRSFIFRFDSTKELVSRKALLDFYDFPEDYDNSYLEKVGSVTGESVLSEANMWINPADIVIVIVGDIKESDLQKELGELFVIKKVQFNEKPQL